MKLPKLTRGDIVEIHWEDIASHGGWICPSDADRAVASSQDALTVGYYHSHDTRRITLYQSYIELVDSPLFGDLIIIPLPCVRSVERVR